MTGFLLYIVPISFVGLSAILPRSDADSWRQRLIEALATGAAW